jgi:hypothetical protein
MLGIRLATPLSTSQRELVTVTSSRSLWKYKQTRPYQITRARSQSTLVSGVTLETAMLLMSPLALAKAKRHSPRLRRQVGKSNLVSRGGHVEMIYR